jgi:soluble lytic murein transglycosylase-like protein
VTILWLLVCTALARAQPSAFQQQLKSIEKQRAAMALTRASVSRQQVIGTVMDEEIPALPVVNALPAVKEIAALPPPCDPLPPAAITPIVENAARAHNLETDLLRAVIAQESAFRPCAVSPKGARGLMQLMPATLEQFKVDDPFDPAANVNAGAKFLRQLLNSYGGDLARALGAYNAGPANVPRLGALPNFPETRNYVQSILSRVSID